MSARDEDGGARRRTGEVAVALPERTDAGVHFIGRIRNPWARREDCPKNPAASDAPCTIVLDPRYAQGLADLASFSHVIVLYWMHRAARDLVVQHPRGVGAARGVFALRSPARPNPIALSCVRLERIEGTEVRVRGLDCLDGTPLIDIKPYLPSIDSHPDASFGWMIAGSSTSGQGDSG